MTETAALDLHSDAGSLSLRGLSKAYDPKHPDQKAVDDIALDIEAGQFVTLLGPSGCGKTTTLRMIAGFEDPSGGDITLDGSSLLRISPDKRPMSMVFQSYALFPHLSVRDNVGFGLSLRKMSRREVRAKVTEALSLMNIEHYADRYPEKLSGGQQQRVALARALVMEPKIVLFDEPLSNLDAALRLRMREEIRGLQQRLGLTAVFVTHDQSEALTMSDVVVVMREGRIEQAGPPDEVYHRPANAFVASFLGNSTFFDGTVREVASSTSADASRYRTKTAMGEMVVRGPVGLDVGDDVSVVVRAENVTVGEPRTGDASALAGVVELAAFDGDVISYRVSTELGTIGGRASGLSPVHRRGQNVACSYDPDHLWLVPAR